MSRFGQIENPLEWDSHKAEHRVENVGWCEGDTTLGRHEVVSFVLVSNLDDGEYSLTGIVDCIAV